jgi:hypothetical protein
LPGAVKVVRTSVFKRRSPFVNPASSALFGGPTLFEEKDEAMTIDIQIKDAIKLKTVIELNYPPGRRKVQPHVLGISSKGDKLLRAFQVEGASESGERTNWKLFRLDKILSVSASEECFEADHIDYNPDDPVMKGGIIARVPK